MTSTIKEISDSQITEVAEQAYADYRDDFIHNFEVQLKQSIEIADKQFKTGECITLDEFESKLDTLK
ncbi:MAG: hypothetical protein HRT37_16300 [Alteromonadaceae bacterium]|nr:hypothetical protein [Alteromonadaceae bacterium]